MNSFFKIFLFVVTFVITIFPVVSQNQKESGSPNIQNYLDYDYGTDSPQNWSIVQDSRGVMYIGNTEGILEYDGKSWRLIKLANNSIPWKLIIDSSGTIYAGGMDEFGYLAVNPRGRLSYVSLMHLLNEKDSRSGDIRDICTIGKTIFFIGRECIYKYNGNTVDVIKTSASHMRGYVSEDKLLIWQNKSGLFLLKDNKLELIPSTEGLKSDFKECVILSFCNAKILIGTREKGFFLADTRNLKSTGEATSENFLMPFPTEADEYLKKNLLVTGCRLNKDRFAFGTLSGGIIIIDRMGTLLQIINKNRGIFSNGVYCMYQDRNNNLWAGLVNGISKIEINSPLAKFDNSNGFDGLVLSVQQHNNKTYIGTTNGVYYLPEYKMQTTNDKYMFRHIRNTESSCWDFRVVNNKLVAPGPLGLIEIKDSISIKINEIGQIVSFIQSKKFPGILFAGLRTGLQAVSFDPEKDKPLFTGSFKYEDVNMPVWRPVEDMNGDLWFSDKYNGVYQLMFTDKNDFKKYKFIRYDTTDGLPKMDYNYPFLSDNKLYMGTQKGIYKTTGGTGSRPYSFLPDDGFGKYFSENKIDVKQVAMDDAGKMWIKSDKIGICYMVNDSNGKFSVVDQPFRSIGYVFKFFITGNIVWMCTNHGLYKYDHLVEKKYDIPFETLIRKVVSGKDSVLSWGTFSREKAKAVVLPYKDNSLFFEFAAPFFENEDKTEFSFYLEGFDKTWSRWSKETKKEYTNLHEGKYVFHVKARNIHGFESSKADYVFIILAPWYRSYLAYFLYILLLALFFYAAIKLNSKRLTEKNIRLENLIRERTFEVEQQKEELKSQADYLELTNKELEKLSVVARETDNAIIIMDAEGNFEWINESLQRLYGFTTYEEFLAAKGHNIRESSSHVNIEEILEECFRTKKAVFYENLMQTASGKQIWAQTTISPVSDPEGNIIKLVAIDSNITKIKEAEEEIRQQNEEITAQRELLAKTNVELKRTNKLITDSIKYSKRIQEAILPSEKYFRKLFPESFVFYKPRDIVSGDFYWMSVHGNKAYFAVVDCTGHGVPGALMSMIGNTLLNEIVNEKRVAEPSKILELLSLRIIAALEKGREPDDIQSDGMDITLCCLDEDKNELLLAAANNVALIFTDGGMHKIIGDFYSIGDIFSHNQNVRFTDHKFQLKPGDTVYLYSDGYQDQFGGENSEKFMAQQFEMLLEGMVSLNMEQQLSKLSSTFESWKGSNKQTDDVLVLGIRIQK